MSDNPEPRSRQFGDYFGDMKSDPELARTLIERGIRNFSKHHPRRYGRGYAGPMPDRESCYLAEFPMHGKDYLSDTDGEGDYLSRPKVRWCVHIGCRRGTLALYRVIYYEGKLALRAVRVRITAQRPEDSVDLLPANGEEAQP